MQTNFQLWFSLGGLAVVALASLVLVWSCKVCVDRRVADGRLGSSIKGDHPMSDTRTLTTEERNVLRARVLQEVGEAFDTLMPEGAPVPKVIRVRVSQVDPLLDTFVQSREFTPWTAFCNALPEDQRPPQGVLHEMDLLYLEVLQGRLDAREMMLRTGKDDYPKAGPATS